jgi:hypothetical protein
MRRVESIVAIAGVLCFAMVIDAMAQDWQVAARSCYADSGAAGAAYRATCKNHDQFDSILACETAAGNDNAMARTRMAGRDQVNTFMMGFGAVNGCQ